MSEARPLELSPARRAARRLPLAAFPALSFAALALLVVGTQVRLALRLEGQAGYLGARDARWALAVYAASAAATAALALLLPHRRLALAAAPGALAALVALAAVAAAGGEAWPLLAAALTLTAGWQLGRLTLQAPGLRRTGLAAVGAAALAGGLALLALAVLGLGLAGALRAWTVGAATLALGLAGALGLARAAGRGGPGRLVRTVAATRLRAAAAGLLGLQAAFAAVWAGAPESQYDALSYKAWLPGLWAATGHIDAQPSLDHPLASAFGVAQLVAVPAHTLGAAAAGRYLELFVAAVLVAAAWRLGDRAGPSAGPVAALAVGLAPHVVWQASTAYEDLLLSLLVLAAALAVLRLGSAPGRPLAAGLAVGFLAGACFTGKLHLLPFAVALPVAWCLVARGPGEGARRAAGALAGWAAAVAPLAAWRWVELGNPVFPYFNRLFQSPYYPAARNVRIIGEGQASSGGLEPLLAGWKLLEEESGYLRAAPAGVLGLLLATLVVAAFLGWRGRRAERAVWAALLAALVAWWVEYRYVRFLLPYAVLAVAVATPLLGGLERLLRRRAALALAIACGAAGASALFATTVASFWNVPGRVPLRAAVGAGPERAYERLAVPGAAALAAFSQEAEPGAAAVGDGYARTHVRDDLSLFLLYEVLTKLDLAGIDHADAAGVRSYLDAHGVGWVLLANERRRLDANASFAGPLVAAHGQIVFADRQNDLYRLVDAPAPPRPLALCDALLEGEDGCWFGRWPLDLEPGLSAAETRGEPVAQVVPACPGATYAVAVTVPAGSGETRVFLAFDGPDPSLGWTYLDVPAGRRTVVYGTAPPAAATLKITLSPLGPTARVERVELGLARPPEGGSGSCGA